MTHGVVGSRRSLRVLRFSRCRSGVDRAQIQARQWGTSATTPTVARPSRISCTPMAAMGVDTRHRSPEPRCRPDLRSDCGPSLWCRIRSHRGSFQPGCGSVGNASFWAGDACVHRHERVSAELDEPRRESPVSRRAWDSAEGGFRACSSSSAGSHSSVRDHLSASSTGRTTHPCQPAAVRRHSRRSPGSRPCLVCNPSTT